MSIGTPVKRYVWLEIFGLIVFSVLTLIAIRDKEITMFYLIYLFWIDEFIKTVFDWINYLKFKTAYNLKAQKPQIGNRFFLLIIYFIFIIVCFGFILGWRDTDTVLQNMEVLVFKNLFFNVTVVGFLLREIIQLYTNKNEKVFLPHGLFSKGLLTLHVSIILGMFVWALISGKLFDFNIDMGEYTYILAIVPFIIIKLFFEVLEVKARTQQLQNH